MNVMKLADKVRSLEEAAVGQEIQIAEMNATLCELQTHLLTRNRSLAAHQAEIVDCDQALSELRRLLTAKMRQRQIDRSRLTASMTWRLTFFIRLPAIIINRFKKRHVESRVNSLEILVRTRDEQLETLRAHAAALTDSIGRKERLLGIMEAQVSQQRLEISVLERSISEETRIHDVMLNEFANSRSWKLAGPFRTIGLIGSAC
jgi:hypothetical protein